MIPLITPKTYELAQQGINNPLLYSQKHFLFETKYDGVRAMLIVENFHISKILNRKGLEITNKFPHLLKQKLIFQNAVLDCEICVFDDLGKSRLDLVMTKEYWSEAKAIVFDILSYNGKDIRRTYLTDRRFRLKRLLLREAKHNFFMSEQKTTYTYQKLIIISKMLRKTP